MEPHAVMHPSVDSWATTAAKLPLTFSQVREDSRLDLEIARRLPTNAKVMMIASGGETAVCLARLPLARLTLVDVNPSQLDLTRCRMHLAQFCAPDESMALLGHLTMPPDERLERWDGIFRILNIPSESLGPLALVAELGPDHCGRYEAAFTELQRQLLPSSNETTAFLNSSDADAASRMIASGTEFGDALDAAFASALSLENLIALFGEGATRNPRQPFHLHFLHQLRDISVRLPPNANPWIWQLLAGSYPPGTPADWLMNRSPLRVHPCYRCGTMMDALDRAEPGSLDFIHLSNILDWLSPDEAAATLAAVRQALKPGGFALIRQLNSSLDISSLSGCLHWHHEEGLRLQLKDRSFFYPNILLASRP